MTDKTERKARLQAYFDGEGFERWQAIYGGEAPLSAVRRSIRAGHAAMLAQVIDWLNEWDLPADAHILDAGCGTGLFSLEMAQQGYRVTAVDIAPHMVESAAQQAAEAGLEGRLHFITGDLEQVSGSYDAVVCLDVLIHYPAASFAQLCTHLASLSRVGMILTYAPHSPLLAALYRLGAFFPRSQRRTDLQMIRDDVVHTTLKHAGMQPRRSTRISQGFYHVALLESLC